MGFPTLVPSFVANVTCVPKHSHQRGMQNVTFLGSFFCLPTLWYVPVFLLLALASTFAPQANFSHWGWCKVLEPQKISNLVFPKIVHLGCTQSVQKFGNSESKIPRGTTLASPLSSNPWTVPWHFARKTCSFSHTVHLTGGVLEQQDAHQCQEVWMHSGKTLFL